MLQIKKIGKQDIFCILDEKFIKDIFPNLNVSLILIHNSNIYPIDLLIITNICIEDDSLANKGLMI